MPGVMLSSDPSINSLLSGVKWGLTSLTFSFPTSTGHYGAGYRDWQGNPTGELAGFQGAANDDQKWALRAAFFWIQTYTNLEFAEVVPALSAPASIRFALSNTPGTAVGYYPAGFDQDGDIWMNPNGGPTYMTPNLGNWGFATILHEVGHALGLKHGHETEGFDGFPSGALPFAEDNWNYSLMTYRSYSGAQTDFVRGNMESDNPTTYMQNDIAALQYMYGANFNANAGNTVYRWNPTTGQFTVNGADWGTPLGNKIFMTVWDGGGNDTYDLSSYTTGLVLDLRPGAFSTFSTAQLADLDGTGVFRPALGNVANARLYRGDTRSLIENAVGGSGNDRIIGNSARNVLKGGAGADRLEGGTGDDTYYVDNAGDRVIEIATGGTADRVYTTVSHTLAAHVEQLYASGSASITLKGNAGANTITGNAGRNTIQGLSGNDKLSGGAGHDILDGGTGKDTLTGGSGSDTFVFKDHRPGSAYCDKITDFNRSSDGYLKIDNKYMPKLGGTGRLSSSKFVVGTQAKDPYDRLIYDKAKGYLYYDPDGTGAAAKQLIVCLTNKASLAYSDIYVI